MWLVTGKKNHRLPPTFTYNTLHTSTVPPRGPPRSMHPMRGGKASLWSRTHLITNVRFKPGSITRLVWDKKTTNRWTTAEHPDFIVRRNCISKLSYAFLSVFFKTRVHPFSLHHKSMCGFLPLFAAYNFYLTFSSYAL